MKNLVFLLCFLFISVSLVAQEVPVLPCSNNESYIEGEILLVIPNDMRERTTAYNLLESWGYNREPENVTEFSNVTIMRFTCSDTRFAKSVYDIHLAYNGVVRDGSYVVPNIRLHVFGEPNDPCFNRKDQYKDKDGNPHDILLQWDLNNTGECGGIANVDLRATQAWDLIDANAKPVIVAVIDTGIDVDHPNLAARIYKKDGQIVGKSFVSGTTYRDDHGHGTHCAGSIASIINDKQGTAGVAGPAVILLMPVKGLGKDGSGNLQVITDAMKWAAQNGANVISMSLGAVVEGWQEFLVKQLFDDVLNAAEMKNVVVVAAAGNNGKDVHAYPAYCESTIAIAAFDNQDKLASFSNFGQWVEVASPGVNIVSVRAFFEGKGLDMYRNAGYDKCDFTIGSSPNEPYEQRGYYIASGTSMACPNAAGVVAMMRAVNPALTKTQIRSILLSTSQNKEYYTTKIKGGRIHAYKAVEAARQTLTNEQE